MEQVPHSGSRFFIPCNCPGGCRKTIGSGFLHGKDFRNLLEASERRKKNYIYPLRQNLYLSYIVRIIASLSHLSRVPEKFLIKLKILLTGCLPLSVIAGVLHSRVCGVCFGSICSRDGGGSEQT